MNKVPVLLALGGALWLLFIAKPPGMLDQQNAIGTRSALVRTGEAPYDQSLNELPLNAHASKPEVPPSIDIEQLQPVTTDEQLVRVPALGIPPISIGPMASSLSEPAHTLTDGASPFAPMALPAVSRDGNVLRIEEIAGSNRHRTSNVSAPPELGHFAPERGTEVVVPPASAAWGSTQTQQPSAPSARTAGDHLLARGRALLARGDVASARLLLSRAIDQGSSSASFFLAQSYDPLILASRHTYGASADLTKAREFYEQAYRAGMREAEQRLGSLHDWSDPHRSANRQNRFSGHVTRQAE